MGKSPSPPESQTLHAEVTRLLDSHDRASFQSGNNALDNYLKLRATQDERRGVSIAYVLADENNQVLAYYTLTSNSIRLLDLPPEIQKKLPNHALHGAVLIGRLAVRSDLQGQGIGSYLVADAVDRTFKGNPAGAIALTIDAIDDGAVRFYRRLGFRSLPENERSMFLLRASLAKYLK